MTDTAFDLAHLETQTFGDKAFMRELLGLFLTQSDKLIAALEASADARSWRAAAHQLKGSALGIGANQVARAAAMAEHLPDPRSAEAVAALQTLRAAVLASHRAIEAHLPA